MTGPKLPSPARLLLLTCAAATLLAACSVLPKRESVQVWQPEESAIAPPAATADFSLRVDAPNTTGPLDGTGIVVMPEPGQISTLGFPRVEPALRAGALEHPRPVLGVRLRLRFHAPNLGPSP